MKLSSWKLIVHWTLSGRWTTKLNDQLFLIMHFSLPFSSHCCFYSSWSFDINLHEQFTLLVFVMIEFQVALGQHVIIMRCSGFSQDCYSQTEKIVFSSVQKTGSDGNCIEIFSFLQYSNIDNFVFRLHLFLKVKLLLMIMANLNQHFFQWKRLKSCEVQSAIVASVSFICAFSDNFSSSLIFFQQIVFLWRCNLVWILYTS